MSDADVPCRCVYPDKCFCSREQIVSRAEAAEARVAELERILNPDVIVERRIQDQVWGEQEHDDPLWLAILTEEVGEAAEGVLHEIFGGSAVTRREVVQVAAVALAWIECIDRRAALAKDDTDE